MFYNCTINCKCLQLIYLEYLEHFPVIQIKYSFYIFWYFLFLLFSFFHQFFNSTAKFGLFFFLKGKVRRCMHIFLTHLLQLKMINDKCFFVGFFEKYMYYNIMQIPAQKVLLNDTNNRSACMHDLISKQNWPS